MHISLSHWISKNPITIHHLHQLLLKYFSTIYFDWFSYCNHHLQRFSHEPPLNMDCPMKPFIYRKKTSTTSIFRNFPNLKTFHFYRCSHELTSHVERFPKKSMISQWSPSEFPGTSCAARAPLSCAEGILAPPSWALSRMHPVRMAWSWEPFMVT